MYRENINRVARRHSPMHLAGPRDERPGDLPAARGMRAYACRLFRRGSVRRVCSDSGQFTRQVRQLEDWIDRIECQGFAPEATYSDADLTTDSGRVYARIKI